LGAQIRTGDRSAPATVPSATERSLASRRNGRPDAGKDMYLWRAVDHEGEVLEILVQRRRDRSAAVKLMRKLLRKQGFAPTRVTTDKLRSYGAAFRHLGLSCHHEQGLRENNPGLPLGSGS
jgi:hypothetical protein